MQIKVNDWVVHPQYGVGRVVDLEMRDFGSGLEQRYYAIAIPTGTVWVPVKGKQSGLRRITEKRELVACRRLLRTRAIPLDANFRERQATLLEREKESSFKARCELLRDLSAHSRKKPLNDAGSELLRRTQRMVCDEWAIAADLSPGEAAQEIEGLLLGGRMAAESAN